MMLDITGSLMAANPVVGSNYGNAPAVPAAPQAVAPQGSSLPGEAIAALAGLLLLIFVLHFISTRRGVGYELAHVKIASGYNWLAVTLMAMFGFVVFKLLFNLIRIPYVTDLVNFV